MREQEKKSVFEIEKERKFEIESMGKRMNIKERWELGCEREWECMWSREREQEKKNVFEIEKEREYGKENVFEIEREIAWERERLLWMRDESKGVKECLFEIE